jgi:hypothetical protein
MKIVKCLVQAIAPVACGALVLSLIAGDAMAAKRPPVSLLWPNGAKLVVNYYSGGLGPHMTIAWPIANGADHYRLTVVQKQNHVSPVVVYDQSPVAYTIGSDGLACAVIGIGSGWTYLVIVTAYSGPEEAMAYSESLEARINTPSDIH